MKTETSKILTSKSSLGMNDTEPKKMEGRSPVHFKQFNKEEVIAMIEGVEEISCLDWNQVIKIKKELQGRTPDEVASKWKNLFKAIGRQRNSHDPFQREVAKRIDQIRETLRDQKLWKFRGKKLNSMKEEDNETSLEKFEKIEEDEKDEEEEEEEEQKKKQQKQEQEKQGKSIDKVGLKETEIISSSLTSSSSLPKKNQTTFESILSNNNKLQELPQYFKIIQNHKTVIPSIEEPNKTHQWSLKLEISKTELGDDHQRSQIEIGKFIEKVQFTLHPTFTPNTYTLTSPPFSTPDLLGWGEFEVLCTITLKEGYSVFGSQKIFASHFIDFEKDVSETLISTQKHNRQTHQKKVEPLLMKLVDPPEPSFPSKNTNNTQSSSRRTDFYKKKSVKKNNKFVSKKTTLIKTNNNSESSSFKKSLKISNTAMNKGEEEIIPQKIISFQDTQLNETKSTTPITKTKTNIVPIANEEILMKEEKKTQDTIKTNTTRTHHHRHHRTRTSSSTNKKTQLTKRKLFEAFETDSESPNSNTEKEPEAKRLHQQPDPIQDVSSVVPASPICSTSTLIYQQNNNSNTNSNLDFFLDSNLLYESNDPLAELVMGDFSSKLDAFALNHDPLFHSSSNDEFSDEEYSSVPGKPETFHWFSDICQGSE